MRFVSRRLRLILSACFQEKNMETYMFERKMDNCKPCGGAIPLCMIDEFDLPEKIVDRKVTLLPVSPSTFSLPDFLLNQPPTCRGSFRLGMGHGAWGATS